MTRSKNKISVEYSSPDIYKYYCDTYGNPKELSQKQYTTITKEFFSKIIDMMIFDNIEFTFPRRLGNVRIVRFKNKLCLNTYGTLDKRRLRPDWKRTKDMWERLYPGKTWDEVVSIKGKPMVFHENKHTEGYSHIWKWDKTTCNVINHTAYSLEIARKNDRRLAAALQDDNNELNFYTITYGK